MANVGNLNVNLTLEQAQFIAGMKQAAAQSEATGKVIRNSVELATSAVKGLLSAMAIDAFQGAIKKAFDYADAIQDVSDRTGASTKMVQEFGYAAQLSGSSVEGARAGLEKYSKLLGDAQNGNQQAAATLKKYGITSRDVDEAVRQAADGVAKLDTQSAKAAATAELFGKRNQSLTATLAGGSKGLSELAQKANELGIVLDGNLIANAGKVNDQLDTLRMIVTAELANVIVQNANAINSMAVGMTNLVEQLSRFWNANPEKAFAIMGALSGAAVGGMIGGLPGAALGSGIGAYAGYKLGANMEGQYLRRNDKYARADDLYQWADEQRTAAANRGIAGRDAFVRFTEIRRRAGDQRDRLAKGIRDGSITVGDFRTSGGYDAKNYGVTGSVPLPKPKKEHEKKEHDQELAYLRQLDQAQRQEIQARIANANNVSDRATLERLLLDKEHEAGAAEIADKLRTGKLSADQAKRLAELGDAEYASKLKTLGDKETDALAEQKNALAKIDNDYQLQINQDQSELARSMKERRRLALEAIGLQFKALRAEQQAIIDSQTASDEAKEQARARLKTLDGAQGMSERIARKQTQSPMEAYLDQIPKSRDEMNDAIEKVETEGLDKLSDGLMDVVAGTKSVGAAFSDMASTIVSSLIRIGTQQAIIAPLAKALFGGGGDSGGKGLLGGLFSSILGGIGHRANGGMTQPGIYEVGERGRELVKIGAPASVIPTNQLRSSNDNGVNISIGNITSNDPEAVEAMVYKGIAQSLPLITEQASNRTLKTLNRRRLG